MAKSVQDHREENQKELEHAEQEVYISPGAPLLESLGLCDKGVSNGEIAPRGKYLFAKAADGAGGGVLPEVTLE